MNILIKPVITEKATADSENKNRYTFIVDKRANKIEIKNAVEASYGVSVEKVRTMNYAPKRSVKYTKSGIQHSKTNAYKKAVIQIGEGDTIDIYNNL